MVVLHQPVLRGFGWTKTIELGPLLNISQRGLMVQYIDSKERRRKCRELSISVTPDGIQVEKIRFETIADFEVAVLPDDKVIRNRSVRFVDLTSYQIFQLEAFINTYARGTVQDRRSGRDRRKMQHPDPDGLESIELDDRRRGWDRRRG